MIYVLGDSIAAGQHFPLHVSWPALLSKHHPLEVRARCGDTTRLALERLEYEVTAYKPGRVIVQLGLNDCNLWGSQPRVSLPAFQANLREIVSRCRSVGAAVSLLTMHETRKGDRYEERRRRYDEQLRYVADQHGVHLIEILRGWSESFLHDEIHLNRLGHEHYALVIREAFTVEHHPV